MRGKFFYQDPKSTLIVGYDCDVKILKSIEDLEEGFVLSTFNKEKIYNLLPIQSIPIAKLDSVITEKLTVEEISFEKYSEVIESAIRFCEEEEGKVVISRIVSKDLPDSFKLSEFFQKICNTYNHSFNYCFSIEGESTWIGATPEVLVSQQKDQCEIYSLAGSRAINNSFDWTEKEKEEQQFVTHEISKILDSLNLQYQLSEPRTVQAGNVEHILSEFIVKTEDSLRVANGIHPTPAVCGIPKSKALDFIKSNESHDRSFYAGIIGWKMEGQVSLYVNLRCAEIGKNEICLYVGGGITKESDSLKEWEETNFKSETLLSVLKKN